MSVRKKRNELLRLQEAFAREANAFHDITLSILYLTQRTLTGRVFRQPNHVIMLWQYYGAISDEGDVELLEQHLASSDPKVAGVRGAELSCYAVVEGAETRRFVKMANRAGGVFSTREAEKIRVRAYDDLLTNRSAQGNAVVAANSNAMADWLNHVLHHLGRTHPGYLPETTLHLDPFAASLSAIDALLSRARPTGTEPARGTFRDRKFRVALSFSGDQRSYVAAVAAALVEIMGEGSVFYDAFFDAELARPNLDALLQRVYHDNADLVCVFLSPAYAEREWCGLEWRAVRDMIKHRQDERVMLLRFGAVDLQGVFSIDGQLDLSSRSPAECASAIYQRLLDVPDTDDRRDIAI